MPIDLKDPTDRQIGDPIADRQLATAALLGWAAALEHTGHSADFGVYLADRVPGTGTARDHLIIGRHDGQAFPGPLPPEVPKLARLYSTMILRGDDLPPPPNGVTAPHSGLP